MPPPSPDVRSRAVRKVLLLTLLLNLAVSGSKILVGTLSGSLSMVADGYHSLLDGADNILGLLVASFSYAPPDRGHPYGHRKFENAATILIGAALLALAYGVVQGALEHAAQATLPQIGILNWAVMIATMAVNLFVVVYERGEGRRLRSDFLLADSAHTRADLYTSLGVIASFAGAKARLPWADAAVAVAIAAVIAWQAVKILVGAFHVLTDRAAIPPEMIAALLAGMREVRDIREVRTRGSADAVYVDLVVQLDGDLTLRAAHEVANRIERALTQARQDIVDVVVHLEPA
ncbi:MAG TPA: cation diffusion facilitator family transporter [Vicinamibacteria bacterium]|jgi:cation diffusion facilitator family transporter|nr:cation diffusion facilitator family transporter [Vicinamibacteria bacterium]